MNIKFTKMQGGGNDFVVINGINQKVALTSTQARKIAERNFGIGCDQILLLEQSPQKNNADFSYKIFNADGSKAEQCGNGARCMAIYLQEKKLTQKKHITVIGGKQKLHLSIKDNSEVSVDMGLPITESTKIPFITNTNDHQLKHKLQLANEIIEIGAISLGNPHAVLDASHLDEEKFAYYGPLISNHEQFPKGANVNFMEIINRKIIKLRTYERGSGETLSCGSGACASVAIGQLWGLLDNTVRAQSKGDNLIVTRKDQLSNIFMQGPAKTVFEGIWSFD